MKFAALTLVANSYPDTQIKVDPSRVSAVGAIFEAGDVVADRCEIFLTSGMITIRGTVEEVSAALEAAAAPPEPETVIDPIDLDRAAKVLEILADAIANGDKYDVLAVKIDEVFGFRDPAWSATTGALSDLAARIR